MKELKIYFKDKKTWTYFLFIPILLVILANMYSNNVFGKKMDIAKIGIVFNEAIQKDDNMVEALVSISKNASYLEMPFIYYIRYDAEEEAKDDLGKGNIDMYLYVKERDLKNINKNIEAYTTGDKKVLTEEELGEKMSIKLVSSRVSENTFLFKDYIESLIKDADFKRELLTTKPQKEVMDEFEKNKFKRFMIPGMPINYLADVSYETPFMMLGNKLEEKYVKYINDEVKENGKDPYKVKDIMQEYQRLQYKNKKETLKQNIPTEEQINQMEIQAKHNDHHSMKFVNANEPLDLSKIKQKETEIDESKLSKEEKEKYEKYKKQKAIEDKIKQEQKQEQEKKYKELFYKINNGNRIYIFVSLLAFMIFMQGILNIKYLDQKEQIQSTKNNVLRNVKKVKLFKREYKSFLFAFLMNLVFAIVFYFILESVLKISLGIMVSENHRFEINKLVEYLKTDIYRYFEKYTKYTVMLMILVYTIFTTKFAFVFNNIMYKKNAKTKNIVYTLIAVLLLVLSFASIYTNVLTIYIARLNPMYLYINGMYLFRLMGNTGVGFSNILAIFAYGVVLSIIWIIAFNIKIKKIKMEEK